MLEDTVTVVPEYVNCPAVGPEATHFNFKPLRKTSTGILFPDFVRRVVDTVKAVCEAVAVKNSSF